MQVVLKQLPHDRIQSPKSRRMGKITERQDGMNLYIGESRFLWKNFQAELISAAVDIVYQDFKKAFDKVPHQRLLAKVRACGVAGQVANWIANCLSGRK